MIERAKFVFVHVERFDWAIHCGCSFVVADLWSLCVCIAFTYDDNKYKVVAVVECALNVLTNKKNEDVCC